jgi:hypothetical protein
MKDTKPKEAPIYREVPVKHEFTVEERLELSSEQNQTVIKLYAIDAEKKQVTSDYKAQTDALDAKLQSLSNRISSGYEMRPERCLLKMFPKEGVKRYYFPPDEKKGKVVREEPMSPIDFQTEIPIDDGQGLSSESAPA